MNQDLQRHPKVPVVCKQWPQLKSKVEISSNQWSQLSGYLPESVIVHIINSSKKRIGILQPELKATLLSGQIRNEVWQSMIINYRPIIANNSFSSKSARTNHFFAATQKSSFYFCTFAVELNQGKQGRLEHEENTFSTRILRHRQLSDGEGAERGFRGEGTGADSRLAAPPKGGIKGDSLRYRQGAARLASG